MVTAKSQNGARNPQREAMKMPNGIPKIWPNADPLMTQPVAHPRCSYGK